MATLTITPDNVRVVKGNDMSQFTAPVGEAINAGQYCRWNTSTGKFELGNATSAAEVGDGFIAQKTVAIGDTLTGLKGPVVLDVGSALSSLNYGADVFLSDTDGTLADAAGTVSTKVGKVVPGWAGTAKKLLRLVLN